jgi:pimeloyl-ACP methyl ester carboxylesterase
MGGRHVLRWPAALAALAVSVWGCGYMRMVGDQVEGSARAMVPPELLAVRRLGPEATAVLSGTASGATPAGVPIVVLAVAEASPLGLWRPAPQVADYTRLPREGPFHLFVPPGRYRVLAFVDLDANQVLEPAELAGGSLQTELLTAGPHQVMNDLALPLVYPRPPEVVFRVSLRKLPPRLADARSLDFGGCTPLGAEVFQRANGTLGLWQPMDFVERIGVHLYALEAYDPGKTPVIFVHGSGGTPRDWDYLIRTLDRRRFQPWFFYYPSGLRLETIAGLLQSKIEALERRHGFRQLAVVAHSMGGLVARAWVNRCASRSSGGYLRWLVTIATPWGGDANARRGVDSAPLVVPSWQDVAAGSAFLQTLHQTPLPPEVAFHLIYSYGGNRLFDLQAGDGTVTLASQLDPRAQASARGIEGIDRGHIAVLSCREVADRLNALLGGEGAPSHVQPEAAGEDWKPDVAEGGNSAAAPETSLDAPVAQDLSPEVRSCIDGLQSVETGRQREAARLALRRGLKHRALFSTAARQLAVGYRLDPADREHVDAMAWMCNLLGMSEETEYRDLLDTVARESPSDKLKEYARRNLRKLPDD